VLDRAGRRRPGRPAFVLVRASAAVRRVFAALAGDAGVRALVGSRHSDPTG
jgi:hypothetical protein